MPKKEDKHKQSFGYQTQVWISAGVPIPLSKATGRPLLPSQTESFKLALEPVPTEPWVDGADDILRSSDDRFRYRVTSILCRGDCASYLPPTLYGYDSGCAAGRRYQCKRCERGETNGNGYAPGAESIESMVRRVLREELEKMTGTYETSGSDGETADEAALRSQIQLARQRGDEAEQKRLIQRYANIRQRKGLGDEA